MSGDSKQVWSRATTAVLMAVLLVLSGCVGVLDSGGTPTAELTPTETTSVSETAVPTTESTPTVTETETATPTATATATPTPATDDESEDRERQESQYLQELRSLTGDNTGELEEIRRVNDSLYVNYTLSNVTVDPYSNSVRDYTIDFVSVMQDSYSGTANESWDVREMVGIIHHPNGTAFARYHVYDRWALLADDFERYSAAESIRNGAFRTAETYNAEEDEWFDRSLYTEQFGNNVAEVLGSDVQNVTTSRDGQTITLQYTSTADNRTELVQQFEAVLILYADLMDNYYRTDINGWNLDFTQRPGVLELGVQWRSEEYIWGRTGAWEAQNYNYDENEQWDLDDYLQDFLDRTWEDEGRIQSDS